MELSLRTSDLNTPTRVASCGIVLILKGVISLCNSIMTRDSLTSGSSRRRRDGRSVAADAGEIKSRSSIRAPAQHYWMTVIASVYTLWGRGVARRAEGRPGPAGRALRSHRSGTAQVHTRSIGQWGYAVQTPVRTGRPPRGVHGAPRGGPGAPESGAPRHVEGPPGGPRRTRTRRPLRRSSTATPHGGRRGSRGGGGASRRSGRSPPEGLAAFWY